MDVVIETDRDVSNLNLYLLVRRGKYPVPLLGELDMKQSVSLRSIAVSGSKLSQLRKTSSLHILFVISPFS